MPSGNPPSIRPMKRRQSETRLPTRCRVAGRDIPPSETPVRHGSGRPVRSGKSKRTDPDLRCEGIAETADAADAESGRRMPPLVISSMERRDGCRTPAGCRIGGGLRQPIQSRDQPAYLDQRLFSGPLDKRDKLIVVKRQDLRLVLGIRRTFHLRGGDLFRRRSCSPREQQNRCQIVRHRMMQLLGQTLIAQSP